MRIKLLQLALFLLVFCNAAFAQKEKPDTRYNYHYIHKNAFNRDVEAFYDFSQLDKEVGKIRFNVPNVRNLTFSITKNYEKDIEKVRAIYIWITNNIQFDLKKQENPPKREKLNCNSIPDCEQQLKEQIDEEIRKTLLKQQGIAEDYARLFARMLDLSNVEGGYISGALKIHTNAIEREPRAGNHAWNWAKIDGNVYLFDATLGTGFFDFKFENFTTSYNELYFMVRPEKMILTHFPQEAKDQYKYPITPKEEFATYPVFENKAKLLDNIEIAPKTGTIKFTDANNKIEFKVKFDKEVVEAFIMPDGATSPTDMYKNDEGYFFYTYEVPKRAPKTIKISVKTNYGQVFEVLTYKFKKETEEEEK
jgi:hypothetical protein